MKIDRLDLLAYGHYKDATLDVSEPDAGLTVVCGPNEAGKSTARRAVLAALWGFSRTSRDAYVHGRAGLRIGAQVRPAEGAALYFVRQGLASSPLVDEHGAAIDEDALSRLLGGVSLDLYSRLFCVDHEELRLGSGGLLDAGGEIGRLLFGASLGSGSVTSALRRLDERAAGLYKERGGTQRVAVSLKRYDEANRQARERRVRSREWDRRQQEMSRAETRVGHLQGLLEESRAKLSRLERARSALPHVAQRSDLLSRSSQLHAEGAVASRGWAERAAAARERHETVRREHEELVARRSGLEQRIAEKKVDDGVLEVGPGIDDLVQGIDRYKKDAADLPKRQSELGEARKRVDRIAGRLGLEHDDGRVVSEAELVAVQVLAQERVALEAGVEAATRELAAANSATVSERSRLESLPAPPDVSALERALSLARPELARVERLFSETEAITGDRRSADALACRIGLGTRDLTDVRGLPAPSPQAIAEEQTAQRRLSDRWDRLDEACREVAETRSNLEGRIEALVGRPGVPDPGHLAASRDCRDQRWRLVRAALETAEHPPEVVSAWASGSSLPDAYEDAVAESDRAADERYEHAAELTELRQLQIGLEELVERDRVLEASKAEVESESHGRSEAWKRQWASLGVPVRTPAEMAEWRQDFADLVSRVERLADREQSANADAAIVAAHVDVLSAAISAQGMAPEGDLPHLVAQADASVAAAQERADARHQASEALERAEASRQDRARDLEKSQRGAGNWEGSWASALARLGLDPCTRPAGALAAVEAHRELRGAREDVGDLDGRVRGIERDLREFARRVATVAVGLVRPADREVLDVVEELRRRLTSARGADSSLTTLRDQLSELEAGIEAAARLLGPGGSELRRLQDEIALADGEELGAVVDRSLRDASLREEIDKIDRDLRYQGQGRTLDQILEEIEELQMDGDELEGVIAGIRDEVHRLEGDLADANRELGDAGRQLREVAGDQTAADLEQDAQAELANAAGAAAEWARTTVAAAVLRKVIADYGEHHRGPVLDRASELFQRLTGRAFSELVPDTAGERQIILARRRNGELLDVHQLSDGTRDQLYLALRLAGIEHELTRLSEPLPVVLDDVLVNFDDERAEAAASVLADLGGRTQVLLFTHHEGVVDVARKVVDPEQLGVVWLPARDHDVVPASRSAAEVPVGRSGRSRRTRDPRHGGELQSVLDTIAASPYPLSKSEIISAAGVDETSWVGTVRGLLEDGLVVREGQRRGARYRLAR